MKRIGKIKVCNIPYDVYACHEDDFASDDDCYGMANHKRQHIYISNAWNKTEDALNDTFMHEVQHCLWHNSGLKQLVERAGVINASEFEELFIRIQTPHLVQVIKQLPKFITVKGGT